MLLFYQVGFNTIEILFDFWNDGVGVSVKSKNKKNTGGYRFGWDGVRFGNSQLKIKHSPRSKCPWGAKLRSR